MHSIIAMAGLAEAAFFYGLFIVAGILWLAAGLFALAWWKRSPVAAVIALILCLLAGLLLRPWSAFAPPASSDPDEAYWLVRWRIVSAIWAVVFAAGSACLNMVIHRRRLASQAR